MNCRFPWCTVTHNLGNETKHSALVATFARLTLIACLVEHPHPEPDEAWVRMVYPVGERERQHDIRPTAAADWSEMLTAIDVRDLSAIAQALYRAGVTLGASR